MAASSAAEAVLVISGHWDKRAPTINTAIDHSLYYDYNGFPKHTYELKCPAKGSRRLSARVRDLLAGAGIAACEETKRGLDHGVFIPFLLIYPYADIPIVQLSLSADTDPAGHLALGRALAPLRDEGVLIVRSGMSYDNMRGLSRPTFPAIVKNNPDSDVVVYKAGVR